MENKALRLNESYFICNSVTYKHICVEGKIFFSWQISTEFHPLRSFPFIDLSFEPDEVVSVFDGFQWCCSQWLLYSFEIIRLSKTKYRNSVRFLFTLYCNYYAIWSLSKSFIIIHTLRDKWWNIWRHTEFIQKKN